MSGTESTPGIIPLSVRTLFSEIRSNKKRQYNIRVSCMEIYDEKMYDLLSDRKQVMMRSFEERGRRILRFDGLEEVRCQSEEDVLQLLERGAASKTMAANYKHDLSSRSHTVFRIEIDSAEVTARVENIASSTLMLVDLAGSEAAHKNTSEIAFKQGTGINLSLLSLKNVVHSLVEKKLPRFRESLLTRLLEPSLAGMATAFVAVICNVLPVALNRRDTEHTLDFGTTASAIELNPNRNAIATANSDITKLQELLEQMESERELMMAENQGLKAGLSETAQMKSRIQEYEAMIAKMQSSFISNESLALAEEERKRIEAELDSVKADKEEAELRLKREMQENLKKNQELHIMLERVHDVELDKISMSEALEKQKEESKALEAQMREAQKELEAKSAESMMISMEKESVAQEIQKNQKAIADMKAETVKLTGVVDGQDQLQG